MAITHVRGRILLGVAGLVALVGLAGCGDPVAEQVGQLNKTNIQRVSNIYAAFHNMKGGRGPRDEAELLQFIREFDPEKLKMMGIESSDPAKLLVSERDGKPFVIRYRVGGGRGAVVPVAFEQQGKDGKRQVGFTGGKVEEVGDAEYQAYLSGRAGVTPAAGPPQSAGRRPGTSGPPPGAPTGPPR